VISEPEAALGYTLQYHTEWVLPYLRNRETLSRQGWVRLFTSLDQDLRQFGDVFRNDPERRLAQDSEYFLYDIIFQDGDGPIRRFRFVVSDRPAEYGILRVVYVEEMESLAWS
jgi:hypothetical protein